MPARLVTLEEKVKSCIKDRIAAARSINKNRFGIPRSKTNVTVDYLYKIYLKQKGRCIYTKIPFYIMPRGHRMEGNHPSRHPYALSIDRIDSSKPYRKGNLQLVTFLFNKMKQDNTNRELFGFFEDVLADRQGYFGRLSRILEVR